MCLEQEQILISGWFGVFLLCDNYGNLAPRDHRLRGARCLFIHRKYTQISYTRVLLGLEQKGGDGRDDLP